MVQTQACPTADRWQALLVESAGDETTGLEAHLANCVRCRGVLDELAIGSSGWLRDAGRLASETDDDPDLTRTVHRIHDAVDVEEPSVPLDFLKPSEVPGTIGLLGRYQILAVLGRGATGIVLKALDPDLLRPVAIKVMLPYLAPNGTARQRFQREARAAAAVSHDHVVTIHAVDQLDGLPFLVMEYAAGGTLQTRLDADGPLPPREVARIGLQAANGLAAAHAVGLIHRDVKPANILLENGVGRVKLTDFGLARAADDARLTQTGVAAGTPMYMSPEQARGDVIDHRSDLFSLGSVLYALLTGVPPFRATTTMGVLNRIANDTPRPIRDLTPDVPAELEAIVMQLLEKDPARRLPSAAEVADRLTAFLAAAAPDRPRSSRPVPATRAGWKWSQIALAAFAVLMIAGLTIYVAATVLKFTTPDGTLIVEVDDPNVKVALDGTELTITGAGPQEVRLKPGAYKVTASKDGKPVSVSQEVVTISRDGRTIVKVTAVPVAGGRLAAPPSPAGSMAERTRALTGGATNAQRVVIAAAWEDAANKTTWSAGPGDAPIPQTHADYPRLGRMMLEIDALAGGSPRKMELAKEAIALAGKILADVAPQVAKRPQPLPTEDEPQNRFMAVIDGLAKTPVGPLMMLGPVDPDKAAAGFTGEEATRVKRLFALHTQIAILIPQVQKLEHQYEKARHDVNTKRIKNDAGTIPNTDLEAAEIDFKAAERGLRTAETALNKALADFKVLAEEFHPSRSAVAATEAEYKKLMFEYDALSVRLAKTEIGRLLATQKPGYGWGDAELQNALGSSKERVDLGRRMLKLRDQVLEQSRAANEALVSIGNSRRYMLDGKGKFSPDEIMGFEESMRKDHHQVTFRTAAIRGMMADFRKLADEIDPPMLDKDPPPSERK